MAQHQQTNIAQVDQENYQRQSYGESQNQDEEEQGKIYDYSAQNMPLYSLAFSNRSFKDFYSRENILLAVGSYMQQLNQITILRMNDPCGISRDFQISESYPATKIMFLPRIEEGFEEDRDLLATSSDILRLYSIGRTSNGLFSLVQDPVELRNNSEYCQPISSFDWNKYDKNIIATASIDSSVTIWDIQQQTISTQLIAHDKAAYDICFSPAQTIFSTVGEDGSVRIFDTRELTNSTILYETHEQTALVKVAWNLSNEHILAVLAQDDSNILLLDKRKPNKHFETLNHKDQKVHSIAWSPDSAELICSVGDQNALIWDINREESEAVNEKGEFNDKLEPKSEYTPDGNYTIYNITWAQSNPEWVAITFEDRLQTLRV